MQERQTEHFKNLNNNWKKVKIASGITLGFTAASLVFPPAIAGAVVSAVETGRQAIKLNLEVIRFHKINDNKQHL